MSPLVGKGSSAVELATPALGYRSFVWDGGTDALRSTGIPLAIWPVQKEPFHARCESSNPNSSRHLAPEESCGCGLHAYSTPTDAQIEKGNVGAVVMGYGRMIVAPNGWRAETAELIALVLKGSEESRSVSANGHILEHSGFGLWPEQQIDISQRKTLEQLAKRYGVSVLDRWEDGEALAREHGAEPISEITYAEIEAWDMGPEWSTRLFRYEQPYTSKEFKLIEQKLRELVPWVQPDMITEVSASMGLVLDAMNVTVRIKHSTSLFANVTVDFQLTAREIMEVE